MYYVLYLPIIYLNTNVYLCTFIAGQGETDIAGLGKGSKPYKKFMDEIRRERAVELSMEGFRFNDLQRWLLLTEAPYTEKYSVEFDRVESPEFYKTNDPANAEVANYRHELIVKRVFGTKHYWFPLPDDDVYLYPEFGQNPGW